MGSIPMWALFFLFPTSALDLASHPHIDAPTGGFGLDTKEAAPLLEEDEDAFGIQVDTLRRKHGTTRDDSDADWHEA